MFGNNRIICSFCVRETFIVHGYTSSIDSVAVSFLHHLISCIIPAKISCTELTFNGYVTYERQSLLYLLSMLFTSFLSTGFRFPFSFENVFNAICRADKFNKLNECRWTSNVSFANHFDMKANERTRYEEEEEKTKRILCQSANILQCMCLDGIVNSYACHWLKQLKNSTIYIHAYIMICSFYVCNDEIVVKT